MVSSKVGKDKQRWAKVGSEQFVSLDLVGP